jgi:hypothetical protein
MVTLPEAPGLRLARVTVRAWPLMLALGEAETRVMRLSKVSVICTLVAAAAPPG